MKIRRKLPFEWEKCTFKLKGGGTGWGRRNRERRKQPLDVCCANATFFVNDQPRCQNHAAYECLVEALEQQNAPQ